MSNPDVIIIGAGLTGLTTAYYAQKKGLTVLILEKSDHIGGVIKTTKEHDFLYEQGPNTGIIGNVETAELLEELAVDCPFIIADESAKRRLVLKNGKWEALPNSLKTAIQTPLFSWYDKFRILGEPFRKKGNNENETLAQLVARRLGKSYLNYAVDPFVLGIYAGDPDQLVTKYAMPKLYNLEQQFGGFIRGSIAKKKLATERDKKATRKIFSFPNGMSQLIETLTEKIGRENIITGVSDLELSRDTTFFTATSTLKNISISAKKLVATVPSHNLPDLLPFIPKNLMAMIDNLEYAKVVQLAVGFKDWEGIPINAFGGLIPHKENRDILGALFMSSFLPNRAPEKGALLSIFMGGIRRPEIYNWPEEKILLVAKKELESLMILNNIKPDLIKIFKYKYAIPQYGAESKDRIKAIQVAEKTITNLFIGGNAIDGIGTSDRIKQAKEIVDKL